MPPKYQPATGKPDFSKALDTMTINEAAIATGYRSRTIRDAIRRHKRGEPGGLEATLPPGGVGRGRGYRISRDALQRWFLGEPVGRKEGES